MVDRGKELPNVAFQHINCSTIIQASLPQEASQTSDTGVRALALAARKAVVNKLLFKQRLDGRNDGLMHQSVAHRSFMNLSLFGIPDPKWNVRTMLISVDS